MAYTLTAKPNRKIKGPVPLNLVIHRFWSDVNRRLVNVHRIAAPSAKRATTAYRRRVGNVALNQGDIETAADIAHAIRNGGFVKIGRVHSRASLSTAKIAK